MDRPKRNLKQKFNLEEIKAAKSGGNRLEQLDVSINSFARIYDVRV